MREVVFTRSNWMPSVVTVDGVLRLVVVGGADALHGPREFTVPISEECGGVLRDSLARHLLLHSALLPLCDAAGIRRPWDEGAAAALLVPVLLGTHDEVDALFARIRWNRRLLLAHGASLSLLDQGRVVEATMSAKERADWSRVPR
ncbi:DUF6357 family protein [Microbacterium sp. LTA6]|uniref:DUF6357 family protein n=1 Tax=unclassified Microbacterium TaxID=2609290 RepID=UPI00313989F8